MKPIKLEIEGIKSFRQNQIIDFDYISKKGIFGIVGNSGSGKSTILDSIVIALYGKDTRSKTNAEFINSKSSRARVLFEFSFNVNGKLKFYEVERIFTRSKKDPSVVSSDAQVFEKTGSIRRQVAESVYKVDEYIKNLLGMSENEFSKCIALPQGEFAGFLKAKPSERVSIIGSLFDLDKYGQKLWDKLTKKRDKINEKANIILAKMETIEDASLESIDDINSQINVIKQELNSFNETQKLLDDEKIKIEKIISIKKRQKEIEAELDSLKNKVDEIETKKHLINSSFELEKFAEKLKIREDLTQKIASEESLLKEAKSDRDKILTFYNEKKNKYDQNYDETQKEIDDAITKKNLLLSLKDKLPLLENMREEEKTIRDRLSNYSVEKAKVESQILEFTDKLNKKLTEKTEKEQEIAKIKDKLDLYNNLVDLHDMSKQIELIDNFGIAIEKLKTAKINESNNSKNELFKISEKERETRKEVIEITESIDNFLNDHASNSYEKLRKLEKQFFEINNSKSKIEFLNKYINLIDTENDEYAKIINDLEEELKVANSNLEKADLVVADILISIEKEQEERESYLGANALSAILENVNIGDECPICKSDIIQKSYIKKTDLKIFDDNIISFKKKLKSANLERDKILFIISGIESKCEYLKERIDENKNKQKSLIQDKDNEYRKFVDINDKKEEKFEEYYNLTKNSIEKIEKLIEIEEDLKEKMEKISERKIELGSEIMLYKEMAEELVDIYQIFEAEKAEKEILIYSIIGKEKTITESIDELRVFYLTAKQISDDITKIDEYISQYNKKLDELNLSKAVLSNSIFSETNSLTLISEKIDELQGVIKRETYGDFFEYLDKFSAKLEAKKNKLISDKEEISELYDKLKEKNNLIELKNTIIFEYNRQIDQIDSSIKESKQSLGLNTDVDITKYLLSASDKENLQAEIDEFASKISLLVTEKNMNEELIEDSTINEVDLININSKIKDLLDKQNTNREKLGNLQTILNNKNDAKEKLQNLRKEYEEIEKKQQLIKELGDSLRGKALLDYVAEEYIDDITKIASKKLMILKNGEYSLISENKEFFVIDNLDDGFKRSTTTLSGGETFVVSLALALAMSEALMLSTGKTFEFFFLDEGFGTLDSELCSLIIQSLYKLEKQNLTIGLISHVKELQDAINYKIVVNKKTDNIGSTIKYDFSI